MFIKRVFDITFSFIGILIVSPVLLTIALLIRIRMNKPVLFRQVRTGLHGKRFIIYKFRTMLNNNGTTVTVKGDPRITPLGAMLRKYKLDELPELWNVLKGDMSFVGPRPDVPEYTERLKGNETDILKIRPGITGPATVKYASEEEILATVPDPERYSEEVIWPDKVKLNLAYYHRHSFYGDILIILETLTRKGWFLHNSENHLKR